MSRLEQMRINFLNRLQVEQHRPARLSSAKSMHNVYYPSSQPMHLYNNNHDHSQFFPPKPQHHQNHPNPRRLHPPNVPMYQPIYHSPLRRTSSGYIEQHQHYRQQHLQYQKQLPKQQSFNQNRWQPVGFPIHYSHHQDRFHNEFHQDYMIQIPKKPLTRVKSWSYLNIPTPQTSPNTTAGQLSTLANKRKSSVANIAAAPSLGVSQTSLQSGNVNNSKRQPNTSLDSQLSPPARNVKSQTFRQSPTSVPGISSANQPRSRASSSLSSSTSLSSSVNNCSSPPASVPPSTGRLNLSKVKSTISQRNLQQNTHECKHCSRKFAAPERLQTHSAICGKTFNKRRTVFKSERQRTNAEPNETSPVDNNQKNKNNEYSETTVNHSRDIKDKRKPDTSRAENGKQSFAQWKMTQKLRKMSSDSDENIVIYAPPEKATTSGTAGEPTKPEAVIRQCAHCNRSFSPNVILKHEIICEKIGKPN